MCDFWLCSLRGGGTTGRDGGKVYVLRVCVFVHALWYVLSSCEIERRLLSMTVIIKSRTSCPRKCVSCHVFEE